MICSNCNITDNASDSVFCHNCGYKLEKIKKKSKGWVKLFFLVVLIFAGIYFVKDYVIITSKVKSLVEIGQKEAPINLTVSSWDGKVGDQKATLKFLSVQNGMVEAKISFRDNNFNIFNGKIKGNRLVLRGECKGILCLEYSGIFDNVVTVYEGMYKNKYQRKTYNFRFEKESLKTANNNWGNIICVGTWDLIGRDSNDNWTAKLVVQSVDNNEFRGYFDWYKNGSYSGREYYEGIYDKKTNGVSLKGTKLENSKGIALSTYKVTLSTNGKELINGSWTCSGGIGTWSATLNIK